MHKDTHTHTYFNTMLSFYNRKWLTLKTRWISSELLVSSYLALALILPLLYSLTPCLTPCLTLCLTPCLTLSHAVAFFPGLWLDLSQGIFFPFCLSQWNKKLKKTLKEKSLMCGSTHRFWLCTHFIVQYVFLSSYSLPHNFLTPAKIT